MAARTRAELMEEISKIDVKINELIGQLPKPTSAKVIAFPWGFWILAVVLTGPALYDNGALLGKIHQQLWDYRHLLLILGSCFGLVALIQTVRSLTSMTGGGGQYRHINERIELLRRQRGVLAQQLNQTK